MCSGLCYLQYVVGVLLPAVCGRDTVTCSMCSGLCYLQYVVGVLDAVGVGDAVDDNERVWIVRLDTVLQLSKRGNRSVGGN